MKRLLNKKAIIIVSIIILLSTAIGIISHARETLYITDILNEIQNNIDAFLGRNYTDFYNKKIGFNYDEEIIRNSLTCIAHWMGTDYGEYNKVISSVIDININGANSIQINGNDYHGNSDYLFQALAKATRESTNNSEEYSVSDGAVNDIVWDLVNAGLLQELKSGSIKSNDYGHDSYYKECLDYGREVVKNLTDGKLSKDDKKDSSIDVNVLGKNVYLGPFQYLYDGEGNVTFSSIKIEGDNNTSINIDNFNDVLYTKNGNNYEIATNGSIKPGTDFYIKTSSTVNDATKIKVTISIKNMDCLKSRILIIKAVNGYLGQSLAAYSAGGGKPSTSYQSIEYNFENHKGELLIQKTGKKYGLTENNVRDMGFRFYILENNTKKYLQLETDTELIDGRLIGPVVIKKQETITDVSRATVIYTNSQGRLRLYGIDSRYEYYLEEVSDKSDYSTNIISAEQEVNGQKKDIYNKQNGVVGPITIVKGAITTVTAVDDIKRGNLVLEKVDADTGNKLEGVKFTIRTKAGKHWVVATLNDDGKYYLKTYSKETLIREPNYYQDNFVDDESKATFFETNKDGKIEIIGLDKGTYYIFEKENNNFGYNNKGITEATINGEKIASSKIWEDHIEVDTPGNDDSTTSLSVKINNEKNVTNLEIVKEDKDTGKKLDDVRFRIKMNTSGDKYQYIIVSKNDYIAGESWEPDKEVSEPEYQVGSMKFTDNPDDATTFITKNGVIKLLGVLTGKYEIEEFSVGKNYGYTEFDNRENIDPNYVEWVDIEGKTHSLKDGPISIELKKQTTNNNTTTILIKNKMKFLIVKGIVWEDIRGGKNNEYTYHYDEENDKWNYKDLYCSDKDVLVEGIKVRLKGTDKEATTTDSEGKYEFKDVLIEELDKYYIEFEYNGLTYTSVLTLVGDDSSINSKAGEVVEQRKNLNAAFAEITNKDGDINDRSHGYSRNSSGERTGELTYDTDSNKWSSRFISTTYDNKTYENINVTANTNVNTNPDVKNSYNLKEEFVAGRYTIGEDGAIIIENVNLGLKRREMPSTSISNDLTSVKVQVNGYGAIYENDSLGNPYRRRKEYTEKDSNTGEYTTNLSAKFAEGADSYTREIYPSDIQASSTETDEAKKLKVYATYTITIRNNADTIGVSVPEIVNYYDSKYNIIADGTDFPTGTLNGVEMVSLNGNDTNRILTHKNGNDVNGYKTEYITIGSIKDAPIIEGGKALVINITYQVNEETVLKILSEGDQNLSTVTEINGYSIHYLEDAEGCNKGEFYAGVDRLSAPGNATPGVLNTYETDTDVAPSFVLTAKGIRQLEGTVFEDTDVNQNDNERKGNGKYDEEEKTIKGVTVTLLNKDDGSKATYYPDAVSIDGQNPARDKINVPGTQAEIVTGEDGYYVFRGVEPGEYLIKYTYANGTTEIYDTEGNKVEDVVQKYKSTIINSPIKEAFNDNDAHKTWYRDNADIRNSDARDDYNQRKEIDKEIETIEATTKITKITKTSLDAHTPYFVIPMEVTPVIARADDQNAFVHRIENIDFGIIERPRQQVKLEKTVDNIKVTLPSIEGEGAVLFNGAPDDLKENVIVNKNADGVIDQIYVIMDNELIYGSHLELKYGLKLTNTSELDYSNEEYYYFGTNNNGVEPVKITEATIVDYLDRNLVFENGQNEWQVLNMSDKGFEWTLNSEEEQTLLNKFSTIVKTEALSSGETLAPTESKTMNITAEKLLSDNDSNLVYENKSEVAKVVKTGGSYLYNETPGNYAPRFLATDVPEGDPSYVVPQELDEADAPTTGIIPPTGTTNHNVLYAIIGMASLIVLGAGTYGIRRFLKK